MTKLYAQPYDISATGFCFDSAEEYSEKVAAAKNRYGEPVEEFEIQFIDGEGIDAELFSALRVHQGNFPAFFEAVDEWADDEKVKVIIAVGEAGYSFDLGSDDPSLFDVDLYECASMRDLAMQFIDEGVFGEIPAAIANYIDFDAVARDLAMDYAETMVNGERYQYRCT